jgi:hypothetical protein
MPSPDSIPSARLPQRPAKRSPAARLLGSTGSAPIALPAPAAPPTTLPLGDPTGPEQPATRATDHEMSPRHFRRADTWR